MTERDKKFLIRSAIGFAVFIGFIWFVALITNEANAVDQSPPQEAVPVIAEPIDVEDIYLRLYVDWDDKDDITKAARQSCQKFSGDTKVDCYKINKYFDKKQISEKALMNFVEFMLEHGVK